MSEVAAPAPPARGNRFMLAQWSELLDDDSFRRFWLMRLASHGASNALTYTLMVLTVRHSASALATGALLLTVIVPSALLGAIAGVAVDRLPRGLILCGANLLRAVLVFALIAGKTTLLGIYADSLAIAVVTQFATPAEAAVVPYVVRAQSLVAANSFINLGTLATQVLGMLVLAPLLLKTTNGDSLMLILAALFVLSAVLVTVIPQFGFAPSGGEPLSLRSARREFAESWLRLSRDQTAFLALILLVVTSASTLIVATLLPKFSTQVLGIAPENLVFVLAPMGIGVFAGLRSVEFLAVRLNRLATIGVAYLVMAAALVALGLVPATAHFIVSLDPVGLFGGSLLGDRGARILATVLFTNAYGFSLTMVLTMGRVLINERIPMQMQGRVFAAQTVLANLTAIVPVVLGGLVADLVGVEPVLIAAGLLAVGAGVWSQMRGSRTVALTYERPAAQRVPPRNRD